jgi:competence protein ComEA
MGSFSLTLGRRRFVAVIVVALLLLVVMWRHVAHGPAGGGLQVAPISVAGAGAGAAAGAGAGASARGGLVVDVVGAVRRPGVYRLARGARVQAAVGRAGGLTRRADPVAVNLAAPLADGEQVVVAARGSPGAADAGGAVPGAPVSLSTATAEQLDALPGVGPVTAQKIVAYRQQHGAFGSVAELDAIPGIGPARLAQLQGLVVP